MNRTMPCLQMNRLGIFGSWPQLTSEFWRCFLSMNRPRRNADFPVGAARRLENRRYESEPVHGPNARLQGREGFP